MSEPVVLSTSLSPSRATTFQQCAMLYRFRVVDKIPEAPSAAQVKGTLVHAVLEHVFDEPAGRRTPEVAHALVDPQWAALRGRDPDVLKVHADEAAERAWLEQVHALVDRWFTMELPARLEPAHREMPVETRLDDGLLLRGFVDRVDVAPDGRTRIVDYKTGNSPRPAYQAKAMFQLTFYALVLRRMQGTMPTLLQLTYLGDGQVLRYQPREQDLVAVEAQVKDIWAAIVHAARTRQWAPSKGPLCNWCDHKVRCPAFGHDVPPAPEVSFVPARSR